MSKITQKEMELRKAVWPHVQNIFRAKDGETIAEETKRIIGVVAAARDAEIREALMQPEVVKEAAKEVGALDDRLYDGSAIDAMQCALEVALGYIGLGDGTGGQE